MTQERQIITPTDIEDVLRRYTTAYDNPGLMARMFGVSPRYIVTNIAGVVVCLLLSTLGILVFFQMCER